MIIIILFTFAHINNNTSIKITLKAGKIALDQLYHKQTKKHNKHNFTQFLQAQISPWGTGCQN